MRVYHLQNGIELDDATFEATKISNYCQINKINLSIIFFCEKKIQCIKLTQRNMKYLYIKHKVWETEDFHSINTHIGSE